MSSVEQSRQTKQRVPAAERRDALIEAAMQEFAHGGLHGTPVDRVARRVGVAQPYVFSLFPTKRDLFIAAVERCFDRTTEMFTEAALAYDPQTAEPGTDVLSALGERYIERLQTDRTLLMLQLHAYAACDDEVIRERVRAAYARLLLHIREISGAEPKRIDEFIQVGMWLNVAAAMGVEDLSVACDWVMSVAGEAPPTTP
jgi:AcrR family transcriptional regulator